MLRWYLSRIMRRYDTSMPKIERCRVLIWMDHGSLEDKCDCKIWCKYPPTKKLAVEKKKYIPYNYLY